MVPSMMGTSRRLFLASSMALRIASGTSLALPSPKPTCPFWSPTTTSAWKLKRRPPFTTFAMRLMWTTFSFSSTPWASVMMRRGPPEERSAIDPFSELESALARPLGDGAHAAVVEEAVAVEHDLVDPLLEAAPRGEQPHLLCGAHVRGLLELRAQLGREHHLAVDLGGEPRRQPEVDRVGVAEGQDDDVAPHLGAVADAVDLERAREAFADARHHVADQPLREPVQAAPAARVVRTLHHHRAGLDRDRDLRHHPPLDLALRTLHAHQPVAAVHLHARGHRDGELADTRHDPSYQTVQRTSPPPFSRRAVRSARMPFGVESTLTPSPRRTAGISLTPT